MILDHIDLRVPDLTLAAPFYRALLPLLGFTEEEHITGWIQFGTAERREGVAVQFFGVAEDPAHRPNGTRIAFRAASRGDVEALNGKLHELQALHIEGPAFESPGYYAVFFEDPFGNGLEICHRELPAATAAM